MVWFGWGGNGNIAVGRTPFWREMGRRERFGGCQGVYYVKIAKLQNIYDIPNTHGAPRMENRMVSCINGNYANFLR